MTINSTTNQVPYTGDGVALAFAYNSPFITAADIKVSVAGVLVTTGFTVTGTTDVTGNGAFVSGTVTFVTPPAAGVSVILYCDPDQLQTSVLLPNDPLPAKTVEKMVDKVTLLIQRIRQTLSQAILYPLGETAVTLPPAAQRAGFLWGFDGAGAFALVAAAAQSASALALSLLSNIGATLVSFLQPGAGGVLRTVFAKLTDTRHMRDFGCACDGVTDDIVNLQKAHDAIALAGGGTLYVSKAKLGDTFNRDGNKVAIEGDGSTWDFSSLGAGKFAVNEIQSEPDVNARPRKNMAHPVRGVLILGPTGATTVYGINISDTVGNAIPGITYEKGGIAGFVEDIHFGAGSFFTLFRDYDFGNDAAGRRSQRNWNNPASANSGERNVFDNCRFAITTIENFNQSNGNADTVLDHCSFNTNGQRFGTLSGGGLKILTGAHMEWTGNTDVRIELIAGGNPQLIIDSPTIVPGPGQNTFGFLKIDPAISTTCAVITNPMVASSTAITVPWDDGGGRVLVLNEQRYASNGYSYLPSSGQNMLAYGDFESGSYTNEFVLATDGSHAPARVNTIAKSGTWSLGFQGIVGEHNTATVKIPCLPGQTLNYSFWYNALALTGTGSNFFANMSYLDVAGTVLQTIPQIFITTTTTAGWVLCTPVASLPAAPPGTASVRIQFLMQSTTSGTPLGYIDIVRMVVR